MEQKIDNKAIVSIFGYPADKFMIVGEGKKKKIKTMQAGKTEKGKIVEHDPETGVIFYKISTAPGQAGSSIVLHEEDKQPKIIGIHKGGVKKNENSIHFDFNGGRLITKDLM